MSSDLYNIGTEFQLAPQTVLRVGYVHNNLRRTIEDLGALDADGNEVYLYGNPRRRQGDDPADLGFDQALPDAEASA
jgi:hypothetical protein